MDIIDLVKKQARVMKEVSFVTYKEWAAYRSHAMISIFVGPVNFLVQVFIWRAMYASRTSINGLTLEQMLTYYGTSALIGYLIMDFADWNLQMLIHTGKFLTFVLRPISHTYFAFCQKVGHRILGFIFEFLPVYFIFLFLFEIKLKPSKPLWALISLVLGFVMMFLVNYFVGITAFWLVKSSGIRRMFLFIRDICSGVFVPLVIFPEALQKVMFFLPFQFIAYVPIRVFSGSYELGGAMYSVPQIVGIQLGAVLAMGIITAFSYKLGIKKFTGVGA
jgi:ABC-2 type transport system permease protein